MSTINTTAPSYADVAKRYDPQYKIDAIVELLAETNPIVEDAVVIEGNLPTGHRTTVRSGLPTAAWRLLNYGVPPSKSRTVQVTDSCGMLEAYAEVDKALAELNGNSAAFRLSEDRAFVEAMNQEMADIIFYGNTALTPEKVLGLSARFASTTAQNGNQIIKASAVAGADHTSVWFATWGYDSMFLTYPKGSRAGLQHRDLGEVTLDDGNGGRYQGYRTHYKWDLGLVMRDWRYTVRLANIDVPDLTGGTYTTLIEDMVKAYHRIHKHGVGRTVIYCNRTVATYLHLLAMKQTNMRLSIDQYAGKPHTMFLGIPIRICDAILDTEALVS